MFRLFRTIFKTFKFLVIFALISAVLSTISLINSGYIVVDEDGNIVDTKVDDAKDKAEEFFNNLVNKPNNESDTTPELEAYKVVEVIDGDTFYVEMNGKKEKIRLIGVDTPESVHKDKSKNCEEGKIASAFTKGLLKDKEVYLDFDVSPTDKYGRYLAYVYMEDGQMLQDILLENGMAKVMTIQPNTKYANHFLEVQKTAQEKNAGFWENYFK